MMNNKLYKKLVIAMMITTISAVAAASAADTTASVRPVDLAQADAIQSRAKAEQQEIKAEKAQQKKAAKAEAKAKKAAAAVRPVDITPELREELAQKIADDAAKSAEKAADKRAKNQEIDPVIVIGRVPTNGTVDLNLPKTVQMALDYNRDIKNSQYALKRLNTPLIKPRPVRSRLSTIPLVLSAAGLRMLLHMQVLLVQGQMVRLGH
ncbi:MULTISPECIES: type I secretion protein TolC [unclassified Megasphaera]|uniref:type I secretion protein TolC n=1 Tax=unclassified Megasphaera TaxID=2626256 RepID=UPI00040F378A|nr:MULTISPECIES: type I secretion protein TolC [unclassified Megasphaera]